VTRSSLTFAALIAACGAAPANAWGLLGHQLVGALAQQRLTPAAAAEVRTLLRDEPQPTLAGVAMWADNLRATDPERFKATARWHYVNLSGGACRLDAARDCPDGECVVGAIETQRRLLMDRSQPFEVRRDALKFVVHLVGDAHQPMHAGDRPDRGGNDFRIVLRTDIPPEEYARDRYRDGVMDTNLHSVWDYYVLASAHLDLDAYARRLAQPARSSWGRQKTPLKWAMESCAESAGLYPATHELDVKYLDAMRPRAERRVVIAARRLARLLNAALAGGNSR
jgi:hypothetical protein